jgi:uncharacterized protein YjbJ (UPF0337 family)
MQLKPEGRRMKCWSELVAGQGTATRVRRIWKEYRMSRDEFECKWEQIRGQARNWWGKLTDDDLEQVAGKWEPFVSILQAKYGYTRETAKEAFNQRMAELEANQKKFAVPVQ